ETPSRGGAVVIDPNEFSADGTVAMSGYDVSPNGRHVAYSTSDGGTDWDTWRIRNVAGGADLPEVIDGTKFTEMAWLPDGSGVYYSRYPKNDGGGYDDQQTVKVFLHRLGEPVADDAMVYEETEYPRANPYAAVGDDGRFLIVTLFDGYETNAIRVRRLGEEGSEDLRPFPDWTARYEFLGNDGDTLFFLTTADAPRGRVIAVDAGDDAAPRTVVPQSSAAIDEAAKVGDEIVVSFLRDVKSAIERYALDGEFVADVELPGEGSAAGLATGTETGETYFSFATFTSPQAIYRLDLASGETSLVRAPDYALDPDDYSVSQTFINSADGTLIPLWLIHRQSLTRDGDNPTLLYGYGGFNISLTPWFNAAHMLWVDMGGLLAIPNLRGGGEYGQAWHQAGTKLDKQNVFDDFVAAARWLIDNDYTTSERLAAMGRSNGGLLVGATMTQAPDLFAATLPGVGVLDMLRYHTASANARAWSSDYGLSEDAEEFGALRAYSPLHNVVYGTCYPATLVTTANLDDRVVPWHSYKFGAALQAAQGCDNPVLVRVETRAGHGAGKPKWMRIEDYADQLAFLVKHLGLD
ncbi:MAG: prolyl oligopeptidase family serine peptidase, partial [Pseudomonadota bacterium]